MLELDKKLLDQFQGYVVRKKVVLMSRFLYWNICLPIHAALMTNRKLRKGLRM